MSIYGQDEVILVQLPHLQYYRILFEKVGNAHIANYRRPQNHAIFGD